MCDDKTAIRVLLRFFWKKGLSAKAAAEEICAVEGNGVIDRRTASNWFKRFNEGDISLVDKPRSGRPSIVDDETLRDMVKEQPRISTRDLSVELGPSKDTINRHLHKLNFVNKQPRKDPYELTEAQAQQRVNLCKKLRENPHDNRFWKRIVTCDEKWIFLSNPDYRKQWVPRDEEAQPVVQRNRFGRKVMLCVWWNFEGVLLYQLLPNGKAVNAQLYSEQLDQVYEVLKRRYPGLVNRKRVLLQQDNAPAHRATLTRNKIEELDGIDVLPHPPYSPDLAPSDYALFRSMAAFLRGKKSQQLQEVEEACREFFNSKTKDWYREKIAQLAERWVAVIENDGLYFAE